MIVCLCRNVSDRDIVMAVQSGVRSFGALLHEVPVAAACGFCYDSAREIFEAELQQTLSGAAQSDKASPD